MKYKAFISYRRSDCSERAQLVKLAIMEQGYNEDDIFLDLHSIHEGEFPQHIKEALHVTEFFILLLSNDSFKKNAEKDNAEKDYYLDEIKMALDLHLKVIPITFDSLNVESISLPKILVEKNLKLKNSIPYYPEYPTAFKEKLNDFMKPQKQTLWNLLKMPTLLITIYASLTLCGGIGMYVYDNFFMSEEEQVEVVADYVQEGDGLLAYYISGETYIYNTKTTEVKLLKGNDTATFGASVSNNQLTQTGFWAVSFGLIYELTHSRLKPHGNGKSVLAYIAVTVSVVAGFGLGCTLERMIFPKQYAKPIHKKLTDKLFWQKVINQKYSQQGTFLIE